MIRKMSQIIIRKFRWIHDSTKAKNSQMIRNILEKHKQQRIEPGQIPKIKENGKIGEGKSEPKTGQGSEQVSQQIERKGTVPSLPLSTEPREVPNIEQTPTTK